MNFPIFLFSNGEWINIDDQHQRQEMYSKAMEKVNLWQRNEDTAGHVQEVVQRQRPVKGKEDTESYQ